MKRLIKKWWFWLVIVLIFALIILVEILFNSSNNGVGSAGISKEEFNEIVVGQTTNFELNSIIDKNDEWDEDEVYDRCVEEIGISKKDNKYTYVYKYYGEKGGYAIITLQADYSNGYYYNDVVVIKKENFNLK